MKKWCFIFGMIILLTGCTQQETFETLGDIPMTPVIREEKQITITIDEAAQVLQGEQGTMYLCDGYTVSVEVLSGGDISGTLKDLTGFGADDLTVLETVSSGLNRFETVWTAVSESGDMVGRAVVLDDGAYHYCVTFCACAEDASILQPQWNRILDSLAII